MKTFSSNLKNRKIVLNSELEKNDHVLLWAKNLINFEKSIIEIFDQIENWKNERSFNPSAKRRPVEELDVSLSSELLLMINNSLFTNISFGESTEKIIDTAFEIYLDIATHFKTKNYQYEGFFRSYFLYVFPFTNELYFESIKLLNKTKRRFVNLESDMLEFAADIPFLEKREFSDKANTITLKVYLRSQYDFDFTLQFLFVNIAAYGICTFPLRYISDNGNGAYFKEFTFELARIAKAYPKSEFVKRYIKFNPISKYFFKRSSEFQNMALEARVNAYKLEFERK